MKIFKTSQIEFANILKYIFRITLKSPKIYICSFILPIFIMLTVYLIKTSFGNNDYSEEVGQIINLFIIPFTFSIFTFSILIMNWESSVLIKQSKIFSISIFKIYLSILLVTAIMCFISLILCIISLSIVDCFLEIKNFHFTFQKIQSLFFINKNVLEVFVFIFSIIFICIFYLFYLFCLLLLSYILCKLLKSLIIVQGINLILIILFLMLGDCALNVNLITNSTANSILNVFGYLLPIKSFQWTILSLFTNINMYEYNILQIIVNPKLELPFTFFTNKTYLILPISLIASILWISTFGLSSRILYKKGDK